MYKTLGFVAGLLLVFWMALWIGSEPSQGRETLESSSLEEEQPEILSPSKPSDTMALEPVHDAEREPATDIKELTAPSSAPKPETVEAQEGKLQARWDGNPLTWKQARILGPQGRSILQPGDTWSSTAEEAARAEVKVDHFHASAPRFSSGSWRCDLLPGAELLVIDRHSQEPVEGASLQLPRPSSFSSSTGFTFTAKAAVGGLSIPALVRESEGLLSAPGYVSKSIEVDIDDRRVPVLLSRGYPVQIVARVQGSFARTRIRVVSRRVLHEQHSLHVTSNHHQEELLLSQGKHQATLERRMASLERRLTGQSWKTLDRADVVVDPTGEALRIELNDLAPHLTLGGTVTIPDDGKERFVKLILHRDGESKESGKVEMRMESKTTRNWSMSGLLPGEYRLVAYPGGFQREVHLETGVEHPPIDVDLSQLLTFRLQTVDVETGAPLDLCMVSADCMESGLRSKQLGEYVGVSSRPVVAFHVHRKGYRSWHKQVQLHYGDNQIQARLQPSLDSRLEIELADSEGPVKLGATPLLGASQQLRVESSQGVALTPISLLIQGDSTDSLSMVYDEAGPVEITLSMPGFRPAKGTAVLVAGEAVKVTLHLEPKSN